MFRIIVLMSILTVVSACGNGKGGGTTGSNTTQSTKPDVPALTVDAGADKVVTVGDRVDIGTSIRVASSTNDTTISESSSDLLFLIETFTVTGTSTKPSDIVMLSWTKVSGPRHPVFRRDVSTGNFWFTAPDIGSAETEDIIYRLTITNVAGESASDTIRITVKKGAEKLPLVLSGEPVTFTSAGEIKDTLKLPSAHSVITEPLFHQSELAADAAIGFYKFGQIRVLSLDIDRDDCPLGGTKTCPYFERVKVAADGNLISDKWAYYPVQKKWIPLSKDNLVLKISSGDISFDGVGWTGRSSFLANPLPILTPKEQAFTEGPWSYIYGKGDVEYRLNLTATSIAGQAIAGSQGNAYPADAKAVTLTFEQRAGVFYSLKTAGTSGRSDDGNKYATTAALRAAHTTTSTPLCFSELSSSALIYFDSKVHGAGFAKSPGLCNSTISIIDELTAVESGVITLAGRPVIVAQIPDYLFSINTASRQKQVLAVFGLDNNSGRPSNGYAYLPGYAESINGFNNYAAFKAWLSAATTAPEAQSHP